MSSPVTVSVTRHVDPEHEPEMVSWLQAGTTLAGRFPGFLGAGWVRPEPGSETWHMLYRFADPDALLAWEQSHERAWWRASATGLGVVESRVEKRTGIEGWFDQPVRTDTVPAAGSPDSEGPAAGPVAPPRWKQAVVIWTIFFPLSLAAALVVGALAPGLAVVPRVLATTLALTPVMTYVALPRMTRAMAWWLAGEPPPWRRRTA